MKLENQTILITGGGSGIGLALAEAFKQLGNRVIVAGRSRDKLAFAEKRGFNTLTVDMMKEESLRAFAAEAIRKFPALSIVIHNAGIMVNEKLTTSDNSKIAIDTVMTNLVGPIVLTNALLPHLLKQASATVMTVTSGLAYLPLAMAPTYSATKAAIHSYTQSLRYQLRGTPVEVQELVPPYVRTSLMGDRQANDQNAMPLEAFIDEVMSLLKANPHAEEILVQNVLPQRTAADRGPETYQELFNKRNDLLMAARRAEWDAL